MSKVAVKKKVEAVVEDKAGLFDDVKGYARKIYLAGLGAYAKAGAEGLDYFKELVKAGEGVETKGKKLVDEQTAKGVSVVEPPIKRAISSAPAGRMSMISPSSSGPAASCPSAGVAPSASAVAASKAAIRSPLSHKAVTSSRHSRSNAPRWSHQSTLMTISRSNQSSA